MPELVEVHAPHENVNDEMVTVVSWRVSDGVRVEPGQVLLEAETSKTVFEIVAPAAGFVRRVAAAGDEVPVGGLLCWIGRELADLEAAKPPSPAPAAAVADLAHAQTSTITVERSTPGDAAPKGTRLSSAAKRRILERGLDEERFAGSGLVRERDVLRALGEAAGTAPVARAAAEASPGAAVKPVTSFRRERLARDKRTEGRMLRHSWAGTVPSSVTVAVPTRGVPTAAAEKAERAGQRLSAMIFEVARLLRKHRQFNALHDHGDVLFYESVNVGFAVDAGRGLKVPVVHAADTRTLPEIHAEKEDLLLRYVTDELTLEQLGGGTFTITDLSAEGVAHLSPVINDGQSAILGVSADVPGPGGPGSYLLTLAFDHQLADGRAAAAFLRDLRERMIGFQDSSLQALRPAAADAEPFCSRCYRSWSELRRLDAVLLKILASTDGQEEFLCSICNQER